MDNESPKPKMKGKKSNQARFPIARIKKLIQADEDVGKVAQATPIVISKALELFLSSLVQECVKDATERGSKKITAYGLKRTITNIATFDFCAEIVEGVADPISNGGGGAGGDEDGEGKTKKKRRKPVEGAGAGRKKAKVEEEGEEGEEKPKKKRASRAKKAGKDVGLAGTGEQEGEGVKEEAGEEYVDEPYEDAGDEDDDEE